MKNRYGEIAKYILIAVGVAGVVAVAAAAPGILYAAKLFARDQRRFANKQKKQKVVRTIQRLRKHNLLRIREKDGKLAIELTKEGKRLFKEIQLDKLRITKPPFWDKKWRIVIFDIPDKSFKRARDVLRGKLKEWEFYPLQKSVWVCPWPCENELQLIAELYGVAPYINIMVVEKIIDDVAIREYFGL